ncbi:MAG: Hsp20 family protein [Acetobacteraceae bacterium]|nr:Hsp20 family protein [Acetobacteraceae bacterium]
MASRDIMPLSATGHGFLLSHPPDFLGGGPDAVLAEMRRSLAEIERLVAAGPPGFRFAVEEDRDGSVTVRAELPGVEEQDIDVLLADGLLTIRAERSSAASAFGGDRREEEYMLFEHSILLPPGVDPDRAEATLRNGMLAVVVPRRQEPPPGVRRVPVRPAEGRQDALARYHADLGRARTRLAEIRNTAEKTGEAIATGLKRRLADLERAAGRFAALLEEVETSGERAWSRLRSRLEAGWHELTQRIARLGDGTDHGQNGR